MKTLILLLALTSSVNAARLNTEAYYQKIVAEKYDAQIEVSMPDATRCDLMTATHAIGVDFAYKWGEAIGQSLNYEFQANMRAGVTLILEKQLIAPT